MVQKKDQKEEKKLVVDPAYAEVGVMERAEYDRLKRKLIEAEKSNHEWIMALPCAGDQGWVEMGERSALIYRSLVCAKLGVWRRKMKS